MPGRSVRATARLADVARGLVRGDVRGAAAGGPLLRDGHADPGPRRRRPGGGARARSASARTSRCVLVFGGSQAVRRFNGAVADGAARLVERVARDPRHRARTATRAALDGARGAARGAARALPAVSVPARRDARGARRRGPARGPRRLVDARRGHRARAADGRRAVSARRRPPACQRPAAGGRGRGAARSPTRTSMAMRCSTRPRDARRSGGHAGDGAPPREPRPARRRGRRRRLVLALAERDRCPDPARVEPTRAGGARDHGRSVDRAAFDADSRPGTDIQRRIGVKTSREEPLGAVHDDARRRPGGPLRQVHNLFELRALVRFARAREHPATSSSAAAPTWSSAMRASAAWWSSRAPRAPGRRRATTRRGRACRWPGPRPRRQKAGLPGLEFGLAIPGTVGGAVWANAGAHESDVAAILESTRILDATGREEITRYETERKARRSTTSAAVSPCRVMIVECQ